MEQAIPAIAICLCIAIGIPLARAELRDNQRKSEKSQDFDCDLILCQRDLELCEMCGLNHASCRIGRGRQTVNVCDPCADEDCELEILFQIGHHGRREEGTA